MNSIIATIVSGLVSLTSPYPMEEVRLEMNPAQLIRLEHPTYPAVARHLGLEGEVIVNVQVDTDGTASHVVIVKSDSPVFEESVRLAVMNAEYAPAVTGKGVVKSWVQIPFSFKRK
jgi:TonB family protein